MLRRMTRLQLQRICRKAERLTRAWKKDFPELDEQELFHNITGVLTPHAENLRQLVSCYKFYNSFDSLRARKSRSSR